MFAACHLPTWLRDYMVGGSKDSFYAGGVALSRLTLVEQDDYSPVHSELQGSGENETQNILS